MLPKWHALYGFLFSYFFYNLSPLTLFEVGLIFFSSVFIDFDHYLWYVNKKKDWNLKNAYNFLKRQKNIKTLMIFHTIEFHTLVALLGFIWIGFFYILIGMIFHSVLDIIDMIYRNKLGCREFSILSFHY